jgi:hypothetical protein
MELRRTQAREIANNLPRNNLSMYPWYVLEDVAEYLWEEGPRIIQCRIFVSMRGEVEVEFWKSRRSLTGDAVDQHLFWYHQAVAHGICYIGPRWDVTGLFVGPHALLEMNIVPEVELYPLGRDPDSDHEPLLVIPVAFICTNWNINTEPEWTHNPTSRSG